MSFFQSSFTLSCIFTLCFTVQSQTPSKIYCEANPNYHLAERDDNLVMASANDSDPYQHWNISNAWGSLIKDEAGFPSIAIINQATGHVLSHVQHNRKAVLVDYRQDGFHREYLWTQSEDNGNGYLSIRPVNNIKMGLEAHLGDDGNENTRKEAMVVLSQENDTEIHQKWKIESIVEEGPRGDVVRIYSEANTDYFLTARDDFAVLARGSFSDTNQEWIKVVSWGERVKDEDGFPAFALVNKVTLKALKHGNSQWDQIFLTDYTEITLDVSILWTESAEVGKGYRCIRPVNNVRLNMDAKHADGKNGAVYDGNELILFSWKKQSNQKWKMISVNSK